MSLKSPPFVATAVILFWKKKHFAVKELTFLNTGYFEAIKSNVMGQLT